MECHSDEAAIRRPYETWFRAMEDGDVAAALAVVTDDVVRVGPSGASALGRAAAAAALTSFHAAYSETVIWTAEIRSRTADVAELLIREVATVTPRSGGAAITVSGWHEGTVRRESDGVWRIARDASFLDDDPDQSAAIPVSRRLP